ncbi:MAG: hypothetical protein GXO37_03990 [Chloroflexi bacterium]|nr:hypothetical protein [Chloroflexota bacterium]
MSMGLQLLQTLDQTLAAGVGIIALGLLLYALTYNLRQRITVAYALLLAALVALYGGKALSSATPDPRTQRLWLTVLWLGALWLPAAYLHLSDAVLATTGRPSRGRRRWAVRLVYGLAWLGSAVFVLRPEWMWQGLAADPAPHFRPAWGVVPFALYYSGVMLWAWVNLWRARQRTFSPVSRRRMTYLLVGAVVVGLGSFPYLTLGFPSRWELAFWLLALVDHSAVILLLVVMAYAVAFFDAPLPDRWVQMRLLRWLARGPITAITVLGLSTAVRRFSEARWGAAYTWLVPLTMIVALLFMQHLWDVFIPWWESWILRWKEGPRWLALWRLQQNLFTDHDMRQLFEALLAAACDRLQVPAAWVALVEDQQVRQWIVIGEAGPLPSAAALTAWARREAQGSPGDAAAHGFTWDGWWVFPLRGPEPETRLWGVVGVRRPPRAAEGPEQAGEETRALQPLLERMTWALAEWQRGQRLLHALEAAPSPSTALPRLRAAARYDRDRVLAPLDDLPPEPELAQWVRDALRHYWGGPKLSASPLLQWRIVQQVREQAGYEHPVHALRDVLREAVERLRPAGERRFTAEWLLYNILELKFLKGQKGREVARRLALSEAELYRKQKVALEELVRVLLEMEQAAREQSSTPDE